METGGREEGKDERDERERGEKRKQGAGVSANNSCPSLSSLCERTTNEEAHASDQNGFVFRQLSDRIGTGFSHSHVPASLRL